MDVINKTAQQTTDAKAKPTKLTERAIDNIYNYCSSDMQTSKGEFKAEITRWRQKWSGMVPNLKPKTLVDTLDHANPQFYPE